MSLESQIAALVSAANNLTSNVAGKMSEIDQKVNAAVKAIPELYKEHYVSPNGNNNNLGTKSEPLATISEAANRIPVGGSGTIFCETGGAYLLNEQPSWWSFTNIDGKVITIQRYGNSSDANPILRMIAVRADANSNTMIAKGFAANGDAALFVANCTIETPVLEEEQIANTWRVGGLIGRESGGSTAGVSVAYGAGDFVIGLSRCKVILNDHHLTSHLGLAHIVLSEVEVEYLGRAHGMCVHGSGTSFNSALYVLNTRSLSVTGQNKTVADLFPHARAGRSLTNLELPA